MRSIEKRFNEIKGKTPCASSYICFCETIREKGFSQQTISRWFNKLVNPDDYDKSEKKEVIHFLWELSKLPVDDRK